MKKILILLLALLLAVLALPAQGIIKLQLDSTAAAKLHVTGMVQIDTFDIGEWTTTYSEEQFSPAGNYKTSIIRSINLDKTTATPIWWAYIITDQLENDHYELHIFNMVVYQGSRFLMNATTRPPEWDIMWQRCQF